MFDDDETTVDEGPDPFVDTDPPEDEFSTDG
jgi:hypothetical protein